MALPDPVIVLPGITANYLRDTYPLPPDDIWTVLSKNFDRAALHPGDLRYEVGPPSLVRPSQLYEVAYKELIEELRHNLTNSPTTPVPVFPFSYDWRQPLDITEQQLAAMVDEVIARTSLLPHYARAGYARNKPRVALVGHSMGGLLISGYLQRYGDQRKVSKVVTLATPYRGSFEAVIKVTTGTANLGTEAPSSREREAARLTPALYHLMPDLPSALKVPAGMPQTLFDPAVWQPSILSTIAQYIGLHMDSPDPQAAAKAIFAKLLKDAEAHRKRVASLNLAACGLTEKDWLCIVGADAVTRVRLEIIGQPGNADFRFQSSDRENRWGSVNTAQARITGDGTVPFDGALPDFLPLSNVVCVVPDDFGYWEIEDKALVKVSGFHGILPNMDMLHRMIVRFFTGAPDTHDNTWGRAAPGVATWTPPLSLRRK